MPYTCIEPGQLPGQQAAVSALSGSSASGFRVVCLDKEVAYGDVECIGDVDQPFVENPPVAEFHVDKDVPSNPGSQGQRFLGHPFAGADCSNVAADRGSPPFPVGDALGVVLTRARWHVSK